MWKITSTIVGYIPQRITWIPLNKSHYFRLVTLVNIFYRKSMTNSLRDTALCVLNWPPCILPSAQIWWKLFQPVEKCLRFGSPIPGHGDDGYQHRYSHFNLAHLRCRYITTVCSMTSLSKFLFVTLLKNERKAGNNARMIT